MSFNIKYDFVGSFLRPEYLKQARIDFTAGRINAEELKQVEDKAITDLVAKQKAAGFSIITDGEFRRATWHLDFIWGFEGVKHEQTVEGLTVFEGEAAIIDDVHIIGKVKYHNHPFIEHFKFLKSLEENGIQAKLTIPSPCQFYAIFTGAVERLTTLSVYDNFDDFADDVVKAYIDFIDVFYSEGGRILQFDDCVWGGLVNEKIAVALTGEKKENLPALIDKMVEINNRVIEKAPKDLIINTHICRGNYHSTFFSSGSYEPVAKALFGRENVDTYYLEYDDERSGGFEPLQYVSGDKKVVLGLITTKRPELEKKEDVIARIHEAAKYIPLERLALSPQCGFASCEIGNKISEEEQWAKLALVREIAKEVWG